MAVKWERLTYTREELFQLWRRFRTDNNAAEILREFALTDEETAKRLHEDFLNRYEANYLSLDRRGDNDE